MTCKEEGQKPGKWAIVTLHPHLPSETEQVARARAWGIAEEELEGMDVSPVIIDDVRKVKRTTNWAPKLTGRAIFIDSMKALKPEGDTVFFATPLCVGFGRSHAMETIETLWSIGMHVYVHSVGAIYKAGDDMSQFLDMVASEANTAYVRVHRSRKK